MRSKRLSATVILLLSCIASPCATARMACAHGSCSSQQETSRYVCPMHGDVASAKPGTCPKCGMSLRLEDSSTEGRREAKPASDGGSAGGGAAVAVRRLQNLTVYDQDGTKLDFYNDLIKGRTVAIDFIFTTCTTICPSLTATLRRVQQSLDQQGLKVQLISISVDPTTDTPERLRVFSAKFGAGPGWKFVTGKKGDIDLLLQALGGAVGLKDDHTPMVLIGNDATSTWTRAYGLSAPAKLVKVIADVSDQKALQGAKRSR